MSNMDPFDEFEFKPLTEGLGFHKKAVTLKDNLDEAGLIEDHLAGIPGSVPKALLETPSAPQAKPSRFEDVLSALEKTPLARTKSETIDLEFTETLPREAPANSPFPRQEAFRGPVAPNAPTEKVKPAAAPEKARVGTRRGAADQPPRRLRAATLSLPSAILDLVIVLALALVFMVTLLSVTKVDLNVVLRNLSADVMIQLSLGAMFLAVMQMYVIIARSFFGRTLGEWTFDLQIGRDDEQKKESYPLRVALRSLLVTATGLVLLPLVSAIVRRDVAGGISGVKLYRQG